MTKNKLPLGVGEIERIVPHAKVLKKVIEILPGKSGTGIAFFKRDELHFPGEWRVMASQLFQAIFELAEFVCKSIPETAEKRFFGMTYHFKTPKAVSPSKLFYLKVEIKMNQCHTHGSVIATGYTNENCKELALEGNFTFSLKNGNNILSHMEVKECAKVSV